MSRRCQCHRKCRHLIPGIGDPLIGPDRLAALEPVMDVLIDAADAFDSDSIQFDPACGLHGERAISNSECICRGERVTAVEFIQALDVWLRDRGRGRYAYPAGQPERLRDGILRLAPTG